MAVRQTSPAIALHAMPVAGREQGAGNEDREIGRGADTEFLVVHVAAEGARLGRGQPPPAGRRRHAKIAKKWRERQFLAPGQPGDVAIAIERDMEPAQFREILGQGAPEW